MEAFRLPLTTRRASKVEATRSLWPISIKMEIIILLSASAIKPWQCCWEMAMGPLRRRRIGTTPESDLSESVISMAAGSSISWQATAILYGNGDGTFQTLVFPPSLKYFVAQFVTDLNKDGKADLVSSEGQVALGNGDGTFLVLPPKTDHDNYGYFVNAVADMNGDGIPDLIGGDWALGISTQPHNTGVMLGNGDGTFSALIDAPTIGFLPIFGLVNSTLVLIADMNDDGRPDILYSSGGIDVLLNTTPTGQPDFKISATGFSPTPVTVGSAATSTSQWSVH